ncbi:hypothetical protein ACFX5Q_22050 [Mesorhizobium sp. IMUNJ 23033]|uniref:hypothetical protein n=1 Tax=Mesorhizobium sp. IMUNJ 23033 TaxID=3378039 RepID=UPI00384E278D
MPLTVRTTLCEIRDDLHALRKTVAARGQIQKIQAIDPLIGVAEAEAVHAIPAHRSGTMIPKVSLTINASEHQRKEQSQ